MITEFAQEAAVRRKSRATPVRILTAAAEHIERVGLYQGDHLWQPGRMSGTAPCTVLHAWGRGVRAARPRWSRRREAWDIFQRAQFDSLVVLSNQANGRPVSPVQWRRLGLAEDDYRRMLLWGWGNAPGRTTTEASALVRATVALYRSDAAHTVPGCPTLQNMV